MTITVTDYLDVVSSWCFWSEPTWAELKRRYDGRVQFQWKIALMGSDNRFNARRCGCVRGAQSALWRPAGNVISWRSTPNRHDFDLASAKLLPTTSLLLANFNAS